jgi:hypothetical protein
MTDLDMNRIKILRMIATTDKRNLERRLSQGSKTNRSTTVVSWTQRGTAIRSTSFNPCKEPGPWSCLSDFWTDTACNTAARMRSSVHGVDHIGNLAFQRSCVLHLVMGTPLAVRPKSHLLQNRSSRAVSCSSFKMRESFKKKYL